jgi:predicted DNA-binding transcriptional regulator AlpA
MKLLTTTAVAKRYGIHVGSVYRWTMDPKLRFPSPIRIRSRKYFREEDLDAFDKRQQEKHDDKAH